MARYPGRHNEARIPLEVLRESIARTFQACGMLDDAAQTVTDSLVEADLRGIHSHGVLRVPDYVGKLTREGVNPKGVPHIVKEFGAVLVVDCDNNMGQVGMSFAMDACIERAAIHGIAFAAVRGSNHAGTMEYYARRAAAHNMVGICATNALPTMAPLGGTDKLIGINPIGIALPGAQGGDFVLDIAFGATAHGKIRVFAQKGEPIPEGWALDIHGAATTDATAALEGLIAPIGAHKGVGLGMAMGMLSSLLSEAAYGTESGNMVDGPRPGVDGHFTMAINIEAFTDVRTFRQRVDKVLNEIRTSGRARGVERLLTPGEIEEDLEREQREHGITLNAQTLKDIVRSGQEVGADLSSLQVILDE